MVTHYSRPGPSTPLVIVTAIACVLVCVLFWVASLRVLGGALGGAATQTRIVEDVLASNPTFDMGPSLTPIPVCEQFSVNVDRTVLRICPDQECEARQLVTYGQELCVYGHALPQEQYPDAVQWFEVDINSSGAFRELVYVHEDVVQAMNPTPTPTRTFTPLPTITQTPTLRQTVTPTPEAAINTPVPQETPTIGRVEF
jgi:hypothetical protein